MLCLPSVEEFAAYTQICSQTSRLSHLLTCLRPKHLRLSTNFAIYLSHNDKWMRDITYIFILIQEKRRANQINCNIKFPAFDVIMKKVY